MHNHRARRFSVSFPGPVPPTPTVTARHWRKPGTGIEASTGRWGADRDDFGDSIDFIGWYNQQSQLRNGIAPADTYGLYLAYHEGHGGYSRASYRSKPWLTDVAHKVQGRAATYQVQLQVCEARLQDEGGWFSDWF